MCVDNILGMIPESNSGKGLNLNSKQELHWARWEIPPLINILFYPKVLLERRQV